MATSGYSEACCTLPPAEADYSPKGEYVEISGFKTYKTGPKDAKVAIIVIYDIFGLAPQTIQGADLLTHTKDGATVYIPDFLKGEYASPAWFPPDTPEKQATMGKFFGGPANPGAAIGAIQGLIKEIGGKSPAGTKFAGVGLCWGAKVLAVSAGSGSPFSVGAVAHPSLIDAKDAAGIEIPYAVLASGDENKEEVKGFVDALKGPKFTDTYADMPHGWLGARGDFKNEKAKKAYEKGYTTIADFFTKHL